MSVLGYPKDQLKLSSKYFKSNQTNSYFLHGKANLYIIIYMYIGSKSQCAVEKGLYRKINVCVHVCVNEKETEGGREEKKLRDSLGRCRLLFEAYPAPLNLRCTHPIRQASCRCLSMSSLNLDQNFLFCLQTLFKVFSTFAATRWSRWGAMTAPLDGE